MKGLFNCVQTDLYFISFVLIFMNGRLYLFLVGKQFVLCCRYSIHILPKIYLNLVCGTKK